MEREAKAIVRLIESLKLANFRNKPNKWGIHRDQVIMICAPIECTTNINIEYIHISIS